MDKAWVNLPRPTAAYREGVRNFVTASLESLGNPSKIRCPCTRCRNLDYETSDDVVSHLVIYGMDKTYDVWIFHGIGDARTSVVVDSKCKLLNWRKKVLAEATIASTDPNAMVHGVPVGNDAWNVWVQIALVPSANFWRPNSDMLVIADAVGTSDEGKARKSIGFVKHSVSFVDVSKSSFTWLTLEAYLDILTLEPTARLIDASLNFFGSPHCSLKMAQVLTQVRVSANDLEKERGAVLEEYRGSRNANGRMQDAHWFLMMEGSKGAIRVLPPTDIQVIVCEQSEAEYDFYSALYKRSKAIEVARVRTHGFSDREISVAHALLISEIESAYLERDQMQSTNLQDDYVQHFLRNEPVVGIEYEAQLHKTLLPSISASEVSKYS
ncbi:hypothetical protein OROMI_027315 [Orobanche minor]